MTTQDRAQHAQKSSIFLAAADTDLKNRALRAVAEGLRDKTDIILEANNRDLDLARTENLAAPLLKRLAFDRSKIDGAIAGIDSLINLPDPVGVGFRPHIEAAAQALGVTLTFHEVREPDQFEGAFDAMTRAQADALIVVPAPIMGTHARRLVELATQRKLPTVFPFREHADAGGLIVYDVDRRAIFRRIGHYVDRIFRGAKPADLPVEQPTEFDLIVNLSGARALGVVVPQSLLVRADEVIP